MKETLEEAADKFSKELSQVVAFYEGAKWMEQSSYSYDEVRAIAYKAYCIGQLDEPTEGKFNQWIAQFKKETT